MTDLKTKIAKRVHDAIVSGHMSADIDAADLIIEDIKASIPPLVWEQVEDRPHWVCLNSLSGKESFIKVYVGTKSYNLYADGFRGVDTNFDTLEAAQAAADEHHRETLIKEMGL